MGKLNTKQIKEIKESEERLIVLARKYHVHPNAIKYHQSEEFRIKLRERNRERYKKLTENQKKKILEERREYNRNYHREKYNNDSDFREKQKTRAKRANKIRYDKTRD